MNEEKKVWVINGQKIELNQQTADMLQALTDPTQVRSMVDELIHFSDAARGGFSNIQNQSFMKRLMGGVTGKSSQQMAHAMENYHEAMQFIGYLSTCLYIQNLQWNEQLKVVQPILEEWEKGQHEEWRTQIALQTENKKLMEVSEDQQKKLDDILVRLAIVAKEYREMENWRDESNIHIHRIAETVDLADKKFKKSISELRFLQEEIARETRANNEKMKDEMTVFQTDATELLSQLKSFMDIQQQRSEQLCERMDLLQSYIEMPWWKRIFARKLRRQIAAAKERQS
ncbi:hypothetical protein [Ammoniphilus sp. CFH 90114]|uniref:hypothetical protein n=1 Tax=Ammoniphilus sp. CFH 90114 TaxID=2493665 RepID=UPI00100F40FE|nr:hypothetical protein [Ammoniphilus sp. CFH 90114]RXT06321.1 hypothetical protein EIZ39_14650 [Ammoniphilus sp. CFH 90114]